VAITVECDLAHDHLFVQVVQSFLSSVSRQHEVVDKNLDNAIVTDAHAALGRTTAGTEVEFENAFLGQRVRERQRHDKMLSVKHFIAEAAPVTMLTEISAKSERNLRLLRLVASSCLGDLEESRYTESVHVVAHVEDVVSIGISQNGLQCVPHLSLELQHLGFVVIERSGHQLLGIQGIGHLGQDLDKDVDLVSGLVHHSVEHGQTLIYNQNIPLILSVLTNIPYSVNSPSLIMELERPCDTIWIELTPAPLDASLM
jgi:hypothetical protein